jgi:hypothetical protein
LKKHTKIYLQACGYTDTDFIRSELTTQRAVDIHHIIGRGKGGKDRIENLMALSRGEHIEFGDKKDWMHYLIKQHHAFLSFRNIAFEEAWFDEQYLKYPETL